MILECEIEEKPERKDFLTSFDGDEGEIPLGGDFILEESQGKQEQEKKQDQDQEEYNPVVPYLLAIENSYENN